MDIFEILASRNKSDTLKKRLYARLANKTDGKVTLAQDLYAMEGGNAAAEYLYGSLTANIEGYREGRDYHRAEVRTTADLAVCAHIMSQDGLAGRMDEFMGLGPSWKTLGEHWTEICAVASLEADDEEDSRGLTQTALDALYARDNQPYGGQELAQLLRDQYPHYITDGWYVREITTRLYTEGQIEKQGDPEEQSAIRLPYGHIGVVMCKVGLHAEFLIVKATGKE